MKILSFGAGMQSTALALMSVENAKEGFIFPDVPIYDAVIFCDLNCEPSWVYEQAAFVESACRNSGIPYYMLESHIMEDQLNQIRKGKYVKIPLWTVKDGKKGKLRRACTIDYKILAVQRFVKYELLGYKRYQRLKPEDIGAHEMHIGFSAEERNRIFESISPLFVNRFPLADMGLERDDNYSYILEKWGLETKASACLICPYHKNSFFAYMRERHPSDYERIMEFDRALGSKPQSGMFPANFICRIHVNVSLILRMMSVMTEKVSLIKTSRFGMAFDGTRSSFHNRYHFRYSKPNGFTGRPETFLALWAIFVFKQLIAAL